MNVAGIDKNQSQKKLMKEHTKRLFVFLKVIQRMCQDTSFEGYKEIEPLLVSVMVTLYISEFLGVTALAVIEMFVSYYVENLDQAIVRPSQTASSNSLAYTLFRYDLIQNQHIAQNSINQFYRMDS